MKLLSLLSLHWRLPIMKTEIRKFVAAVSTLGLLASCAQTGALDVGNDNTSVGAQSTRTSADHDSIASRYENMASELLVKAEEHKKLLQHYEDKSYLYGRRGQDSQSQAVALVRKYRRAAEKTATQATFHRRMASELAKVNYAASGEPTRQPSNR
jgi:hypothetical protein